MKKMFGFIQAKVAHGKPQETRAERIQRQRSEKRKVEKQANEEYNRSNWAKLGGQKVQLL